MFSFVGACKLFGEVVAQPVSLVLLWIGCSADTRRKHRIRVLAWNGCFLFAFLEMLPSFLLLNFEGILAPVVLLAVSLRMLRVERRPVQHGKSGDRLYVGKVVAAAGISNFVLTHVTFLNATLTFVVALQSILLPLIVGMEIFLPLVDTMGNSLLFVTQYAPNPFDRSFPQVRVLIPPTDVAVVYGCTGMGELLIVFFAVIFTQAEQQEKKKALWLAGSIIYGANILRNNLVIALYGGRWTSFEIIHSLFGNILIFLALTVAALVVFFTIPEVPNRLFSIFTLKKIWPR
jgi:exosortase/archaeosortase family protein